MKICVLANSHAKMLKLAVRADRPTLWKPRFFASPGGSMGAMAVSSKGLTPLNSTLKSRIQLSSRGRTRVLFDDYDAFIVAGLGLRTPPAYNLFAQYQPYSIRVDRNATLVSEAAFRATLRDIYSQSIAYRFITALRRTRKPVFIVPAPVPNERLLLQKDYRWIKKRGGPEAIQWLNAACLEEWQAMLARHHTRFVTQPLETIGPSGLTLEVFADKPRLNDGRKEDAMHAGVDYGLLILNKLNEAVIAVRPNLKPISSDDPPAPLS